MKSAFNKKNVILICYCIAIVSYFIQQTLFCNLFSKLYTICNAIWLLCIIIPAFFELCDFKIKNLKFFIYSFLLLLSIILFIFVDKSEYKIIGIFLFSIYLKDIYPEKVLKAYSYTIFVSLLALFAFDLIGIFKNVSTDTIVFSDFSKKYIIRKQLGFGYCTFSANFFFSATVAYIGSIKNRIHILPLSGLICANLYIFIMTHTRAVFFLTLLVLLGNLILNSKKIKTNIFKRKLLKFCFKYSTIIFAFITLIIQMLYIYSPNDALINLNSLLSSRLSLGKQGFDNYGITLFGQYIEYASFNVVRNDATLNYFYIDSSYIQILLENGIALFIIILLLMTSFSKYAVKSKKINLCLAVFAISLHACSDPQLFSFAHNFILISSMFTVLNSKYIYKKRCYKGISYENICCHS